MKKKKLLLSMLALLVLTILNMNMPQASASPLSPYIMVVPSSQNISSFPGGNRDFTVAVTTDYNGYDLWGYQIQMNYNTSLLQCVQVSNGNLITESEDLSAQFNATINEGLGEISVGAYFYYNPQYPPPYTTSGPGTLASITFRVLSAGASDLILQKATKLQGFNFTTNQVYNIILADLHPDNIGHGAVTATIGDVNGDSTVDAADLTGMRNAYGSSGGPPPSPNWNPNCDFFGDNKIGVSDLYYQGRNYGKSW